MALLEVGKVIRPHGLAGEVVVTLVTNRVERLAPGTSLGARAPIGRRGTPLPSTLEVVSSRPHQGRYLVTFAGVVGHDAAEALRDVILLAEPITEPDALFVHELIGSEVVDQDGIRRGRVVTIEANPASDLLVLDDKQLVPMRFITTIEAGVINIEVPAGLFE